jgi:hypothetical protein
MKTLIFVAAVAITGCSTYTQPVDIATLPNDCANKERIANWLAAMANLPQHKLESKEEYEKTRRTYRQKLWHLNYVCNSM